MQVDQIQSIQSYDSRRFNHNKKENFSLQF